MTKPMVRLRIQTPNLVRHPKAAVKMKLSDLFPILAQAHRCNMTWLKERADDEIVVSRELADEARVLLAAANERSAA